MKRVYAKEEYCLGCRLCEVYCVVNHSESQDIIKAYKLEEITPRIVIESKGIRSFALQCRHCDDAACRKACITGALERDPKTGEVTYDQDKCVGCWTCIMACSYGVIQRDESSQKVISKCDLCGEKEEKEPACVANCPNGALVFEDRGE